MAQPDEYKALPEEYLDHDKQEEYLQQRNIDQNSDLIDLEPVITRDPSYPYNKSIRTIGGIIIEYDDSPGAQRIHISHPAGTFINFDHEGNLHIKVEKDSGHFVKGDITVKVMGNAKIDVVGTVDMIVGGNTKIDCAAAVTVEAANKVYLDGDSSGVTTGCVTGESLCPFTGANHLQRSGSVEVSD